MSTGLTIEQMIDEVKGYVSDLAKRMATLDDKTTAAWLKALRAYREKLSQLGSMISFVVRDVLYSKIVAAQAPWAPQPSVTPAQISISYPLKTNHPVLGEIPYVQSMRFELKPIDIRYIDIVDAIVEGSFKVLYGGQEYRPAVTAHVTQCYYYDEPDKMNHYCNSDPMDGMHKCIAYYAMEGCPISSAIVSIPDEQCEITIFVEEGRAHMVTCLTNKCCSADNIIDLTADEDYDSVSNVEYAAVFVDNTCSGGDAILVTSYGNVIVRPQSGALLFVTRARGMRDACNRRLY